MLDILMHEEMAENLIIKLADIKFIDESVCINIFNRFGEIFFGGRINDIEWVVSIKKKYKKKEFICNVSGVLPSEIASFLCIDQDTETGLYASFVDLT